MRTGLALLLGCSVLLVLAAPARAAKIDTRGATSCRIGGYSKDPDPRGTNLRAGPSSGAAVVGRLPPGRDAGGIKFWPEFDVVGSKNGWLLIRDAVVGGYDDGPERIVFRGPAWISAGLVDFSIQADALRAEPHDGAAVLEKLEPDNVHLVKVHGCSGSFADVTIKTEDGREVRGWASSICRNQATTCV